MSRLLTEIERQSIEQRIAKIENDTSGEVVVVIKERSDNYRRWGFAAGALGAVAAAVIVHTAQSKGGTAVVDPLHILYAAGIGAAVATLLFFIPKIQAAALPGAVREQAVRDAAARQFAAHGVGRTKQRTGILLYISAFERRAVVLADEGLSRIVPEGFWEAQAVVLSDGLMRRQLAVAIHKVLSSLGELLHLKCPAGRQNVNELSNRLDMPPDRHDQ